MCLKKKVDTMNNYYFICRKEKYRDFELKYNRKQTITRVEVTLISLMLF